jgi:hypothetical protein
MPDGWRMTSEMQTGRMVGTDPELEDGLAWTLSWKRSSRCSPRPVADPVIAQQTSVSTRAPVVSLRPG